MPSSKGGALITGGARRIGAEIAVSLARNGFDIALHYRTSHDAALTVAAAIARLGRQCHLVRCDLTRGGDRRTLIDRTDRLLPHFNLLVNNASVFESGRLVDTEPECFERHFDVNLKAPFFLVRDFCRAGRTGQVINILDTRVARSDGSHVVYTLSKRALFEFTRMAAKELGPAIRVNAVAPGLILPPAGETEAYLHKKSVHIPLKKKGDTGSLISAILFLIDNPFVTGECIFVDGGEHL